MRDYPVGKVQKMVLDALTMTATGHGDAEKKFSKLGIVVTSKRLGRKSVPVVRILDRQDSDWNRGGDADVWQKYADHDFSAIEQWIVD